MNRMADYLRDISDALTAAAPQHGGNLSYALQRYGGMAENWLDLSTGISPYSWPVKQFIHQAPEHCWQQLPSPELYQTVQRAAAAYYSCFIAAQWQQYVLAAGSQALIQQLPLFFSQQVFQRPVTQMTLWLLAGSYGEHKYRWQQAGVNVIEKSLNELQSGLNDPVCPLPDVLLLVNPDNPSGHCWSVAELHQWQQKLAANNGWLILDCAFNDALHNAFLAPGNHLTCADNLMLLTSLGKFFGLAGLRLGCAILPRAWAEKLTRQLGPWPVSGLTLWLAQKAFADTAWQQQNRNNLEHIKRQLCAACEHLPVDGSGGLFLTLQSHQAEHWQHQLATKKIWTRCFNQQQKLRFGLPQKDDMPRLLQALKTLKTNKPL